MRGGRLTLERALAREILYQGYTASRQSGFRPTNPVRSVSRANTMKYALGSIWLIVIVGYSFALRFERAAPLGMMLIYFGWGGLLIVSNLLPASYAVQGSSYMRDALYLLPIDEGELERMFARAFMSLIDYPLVALLAGSALASAIVGAPYPFLGVVFGIEVAIIAIEATIFAFSSASKSQAKSYAMRALSALLPLIFLIFLISPAYFAGIDASRYAPLEFLPLASGAFIYSPIGAAFTAIWAALLGYYAYTRLPSAALRILHASSPATIAKRVRGGWRIIRSRTLAILRADIQMSARSVMASMLVVPFVLFVVFMVTTYNAPPGVLGAMSAYYGIEIAYFTIFIPYSLYAIEVRGAAAMRTLPVTRVSMALPKILLLLVVYYAFEGTFSAAMALRGVGPAYVAPLLAGVLAPASSIPAAGIMFERTLREGGSLSTLQAVLNFILISLLVGVPYGIYYAVLYATGSELLGIASMVSAGAAEFSALMYSLSRYGRAPAAGSAARAPVSGKRF